MTYVPQNKHNLVVAAAAAATLTAATERAARPRWRRMTRRTLALTALVAAIPVTVTAAVVTLVLQAPAPDGPLPFLGDTPAGRAIDRSPLPHPPTSQLEAYSRLGRPATAADDDDDDNAAVRRYARNARKFGLDASAARTMATVDGQRLWLIPGNGFLCLGVQPIGDDTLSAGCNTEAVALRDGVNVLTGDAIYGLLPDGIDKIEVTDDDGFRHVEPVTDNAYILKPSSATIRYPVGPNAVEMFRVIGRSSGSPSSG